MKTGSMNIRKHLSLLGKRVRDRVTGKEGIVDSVGFDLYGCVQAAINAGLDKEGEPRKSYWYDVSRFEVIDEKTVMPQPDWDFGAVAEGRHGPATKPERQLVER